MALAVYINFEKEMAKITKNQNLEKVSRFAFSYGFSWGSGTGHYRYALEGCERMQKNTNYLVENALLSISEILLPVK